MFNFVEPANIDEARKRAQRLLDDMQIIEIQKSDKSAEINQTRLLPSEFNEYMRWKEKQNSSHRIKLLEYRRLKEWIRVHEQRKAKPISDAGLREELGFNPNDPEILLLFLHHVVVSMLKSGVEISVEHQITVNAVRSYIDRMKQS